MKIALYTLYISWFMYTSNITINIIYLPKWVVKQMHKQILQAGSLSLLCVMNTTLNCWYYIIRMCKCCRYTENIIYLLKQIFMTYTGLDIKVFNMCLLDKYFVRLFQRLNILVQDKQTSLNTEPTYTTLSCL